jgi:hypothetical protein
VSVAEDNGGNASGSQIQGQGFQGVNHTDGLTFHSDQLEIRQGLCPGSVVAVASHHRDIAEADHPLQRLSVVEVTGVNDAATPREAREHFRTQQAVRVRNDRDGCHARQASSFRTGRAPHPRAGAAIGLLWPGSQFGRTSPSSICPQSIEVTASAVAISVAGPRPDPKIRGKELSMCVFCSFDSQIRYTT